MSLKPTTGRRPDTRSPRPQQIYESNIRRPQLQPITTATSTFKQPLKDEAVEFNKNYNTVVKFLFSLCIIILIILVLFLPSTLYVLNIPIILSFIAIILLIPSLSQYKISILIPVLIAGIVSIMLLSNVNLFDEHQWLRWATLISIFAYLGLSVLFILDSKINSDILVQ